MLEIQNTALQDITIIALKGDITSASAVDFERQLAGFFQGNGPKRWAFDLSGLTFTSSAGLRVLLATAKKMKNSGGRMALYGTQPGVLEVFELSGFTRILTFVPDAASAQSFLTAP